MAKLTPKQRRFIEEYLIDLNATQAAIRSGYSEKTAYAIGIENLKKPQIASAIQSAMERRSDRTAVSQEKVVRELARVAFASVGKIMEDTNGGLMNNLSNDDLAAVSCVKTKTSKYPNSDEEITDREIRFHDKIKALELLGKHLGIFTENISIRGALPITIVDDIGAADAGRG